MEFWLLISVLALLGILTILVVLIILRKGKDPFVDLIPRLDAIEKNQSRIEIAVKDEISQNRQESGKRAKGDRDELAGTLKIFNENLVRQMADNSKHQKGQLDTFSKQLTDLTKTNENRMTHMTDTLEKKLKDLQEDNAKKLNEMRQTVDEKLQTTLEKRLGESFKEVSDRLKAVHEGLGEMKTLASGVGDLKSLLTNVKSRGTWGEKQLEAILEEYLTPGQYEKNVAIKTRSNERVEFAIKLPGRKDSGEEPVYLPIDSKFPQEDYQRLQDAQSQADPIKAEEAGKALEMRLKQEARTIRDKYISPPRSTDFGILFLPTESLYAEVLRRPGLTDSIQRDYRVIVSGPTTFMALLTALQMGFRTLVVEKKSAEIWKLLGAIKMDFGRFGEVLSKTHEKIMQAGDQIEKATKRTDQIRKKLDKVEDLPAEEAPKYLEPMSDETDFEKIS